LSYRSPWASPLFRASVAARRRLLRWLGRPEEPWIRRLVATQNARVHRHLQRRPPRSVLLILPRCVKRPDCPIDVRGDLSICATCDRCPLGEVARLTAGRGVRALVAFRSHHAFAMARRERPDLIVAAACEDRLIKALAHVPDVPALLSPLTGMDRRCVGADFDLAWVARQLALAPPPARPAAPLVPAAADPAAG
jgi:hypothetical protein